MAHLLHTRLERGTILELQPRKVEAGTVETGDYVFDFHDAEDDVHVRVILPVDDFKRLITSCAEQLANGNGDGVAVARPEIAVARVVPRMQVPTKRR